MLPIIHPDACENYMDEMLAGTMAKLGNNAALLSVAEIMSRVLGRTPVDVGGPTRITDLPPIMECNTNSYFDMVRILRHAVQFYGAIPLVLRIIGDGQSVLMASYLKRHYPESYKHVLITNAQRQLALSRPFFDPGRQALLVGDLLQHDEAPRHHPSDPG